MQFLCIYLILAVLVNWPSKLIIIFVNTYYFTRMFRTDSKTIMSRDIISQQTDEYYYRKSNDQSFFNQYQNQLTKIIFLLLLPQYKCHKKPHKNSYDNDCNDTSQHTSNNCTRRGGGGGGGGGVL